ncbi:hypothetical protein [Streptomyces avermitilis]|uniref:hypothetical protein n=1 Tax=Streptomyces avermitilis TaxID=33903 RepID=UPI00368EA72C
MMKQALWQGLLAGAAGAVAMTLSERAEQRLTGRPDSEVPGLTMRRLTGMAESTAPVSTNWTMHVGQAAAMGVLRSVMAHVGLRGPLSSAKFTVVRLTADQILENATGVGAPPQTWPRAELLVDVLHKAVYGLTTGVVADALAACSGLGPGQRHAAMAPGRHPHAGPLSRAQALSR